MNLISRIRTLARVRPLPEGDLPEVAETVAIIMDGNGRWARRRGLPTAVGHRAGHAGAAPHGRGGDRARDPPPRRLRVLDRELVAAAGRGRRADGDLRRDDRARAARPRRAGRPRPLHRPPRPRAGRRCARRMEAMEDRTELNTRLGLWIAFDYGGRAELVEATRRIAESGMDPREIDENVLAANLYAPELPDPGPPDPHERRAARLELHALAARLRRARLRRPPLAGLRRARPPRRRSPSTRSGGGASAAGDR